VSVIQTKKAQGDSKPTFLAAEIVVPDHYLNCIEKRNNSLKFPKLNIRKEFSWMFYRRRRTSLLKTLNNQRVTVAINHGESVSRIDRSRHYLAPIEGRTIPFGKFKWEERGMTTGRFQNIRRRNLRVYVFDEVPILITFVSYENRTLNSLVVSV